MNKNQNFKSTIYACFLAYVVQAIVNNFVPLLFLTFQKNYDIPLSQITILVTFNFTIQLLVDFFSTFFADKIGYRFCMLISHFMVTLGLILLCFLPNVTNNAFTGLLVSVCIYAVGGGLIEVLVSPIVESCPSHNKEAAMSLLHSFYCWGHVGVVLISTLFFSVCGINNWHFLALFWAMFSFFNGILFVKVPIAHLIEEDNTGMTLKDLFKEKVFYVLLLMMLCAGASEQAVSQWASTFAEKGLGISKTLGDLCGPMMFAAFMGISRAFYGKYGEKIKLEKFMILSTVICIISYLGIAFIPNPLFSLISCSICGLSVGIMWPGTFSKASAMLKAGGTAMFAFLALAGDMGCMSGPTFVGLISDHFNDNLKVGIGCAVIIPVILIFSILLCKKFSADSK